MPIIFKLINQFQDNNIYEIKSSFEGELNIKLLNDFFAFLGLSPDEIDIIKFFINTEQIKNPDTVLSIKAYDNIHIYVYTSNIELRKKLSIIFMKKNNKLKESQTDCQPVFPEPEICKPITMKVTEPIPKLTCEIIDFVNKKSVSLFADNDFKSLISIYLRRPELFGTFAQYVQNGNIIEESLDNIKTRDELTDEELKHYQSLADKINHLEIDVTNEVIINKLIKYSGHLNLALRSILCDMAKNHSNKSMIIEEV